MDASTRSTTKIFNLNDDCLREVFECMDPFDLITIADVCTRFRQNAALSARFKFKRLELGPYSPRHEYSILRNFGAFVKSMKVYGGYIPNSRAKYQKRLIEFLSMYWTEMSIEFEISEFDITDEIALLMLPTLARMRKLQFSHCKLNALMLRNLPLWSPKLRQLKFVANYFQTNVLTFNALHQKFPKLKLISFISENSVNNIGVEQYLEQNPQLKQLEIIECCGIDDNVSQSIAKYLPKLERITFFSDKRTHRENIENFDQLRNLKSLTLQLSNDPQFIPLFVQQITSDNYQLEFLDLGSFDLLHDSQQFIDGISKLKKLKTLLLYDVTHMTAFHLIEICKHLKELMEIQLKRTIPKMTEDNLLELIQNAEKLQKFVLYKPTIITDDTFNKLVKIVEQRHEKIKLNILVNSDAFTAKIPAELIRAASSLLTVQITYR